MLSEVGYGALLAYSPRGQSEFSKRSRSVCYKLKEGNPETLQLAAQRLNEHVASQGFLASFFDDSVTLVPMPRSAPLVQGALWPALKICEAIVLRWIDSAHRPGA